MKENEEVFHCFILDILPPQPQELEAMNITDKSFILKWKTVTGEGSLDERSLYQVMHTFISYTIRFNQNNYSL